MEVQAENGAKNH